MKPDTQIYRYFDFFALADTIKNRRLRFSMASTFRDRNEGLEILFNSLRAAVESKDGAYSGITSQDQIDLIQKSLKRTSFVCSWSREAESIALWSLYSPDGCGVRITSTVAKLQAALNDFLASNSLQSQFTRFGLIDGVSYAYVNGQSVREVDYKNLRKLHKDIRNVALPSQNASTQEESKTFDFLTLKDEAYKHEHEVRGIVVCGAAIPSDSNGLLSLGNTTPWLLGDHLYMDIHDNFIDAVAIDPRCPRYKRDVIEGYLREHNVALENSDAFGYLPEEVDFVTPKQGK